MPDAREFSVQKTHATTPVVAKQTGAVSYFLSVVQATTLTYLLPGRPYRCRHNPPPSTTGEFYSSPGCPGNWKLHPPRTVDGSSNFPLAHPRYDIELHSCSSPPKRLLQRKGRLGVHHGKRKRQTAPHPTPLCSHSRPTIIQTSPSPPRPLRPHPEETPYRPLRVFHLICCPSTPSQ